jgi:hypothetical protein
LAGLQKTPRLKPGLAIIFAAAEPFLHTVRLFLQFAKRAAGMYNKGSCGACGHLENVQLSGKRALL